MKIIIIGAGIAGLSLAIALAQSNHQVIILDSASELAELGAGVQMTPQAIRYLFQWGLKDDITSQSIVPEEMLIKDSVDGTLLGKVPTGEMAEEYGAPYIVIHRANLHDILHKHAIKAGAELQLNSKVVRYDFDAGVVHKSNGESLDADLIVAADGINSFARQQLLGAANPGSRPTGWAAIRMMAEIATLQQDPLTAGLVDTKTRSSHLWIAANKSCMAYQIKDGTMLNIVLSHRDDMNMFNFTPEEYRATVTEWFKDFEPSLIGLSTPKIMNYPVFEVPSLTRWSHDSGKFTLIGDAAHAMAFYLSMGVSLAVEDAVTLASVLNLASPPSTSATPAVDESRLRKAIGAFEKVRKSRAQAVQEASLHAGNTMHIQDHEKRKRLYALIKSDGVGENTPFDPATISSREGYGLAAKDVRDWCYNYDAIGEAEKAYNEL